MKFQEGDKIVVTATGEKGIVIEWINKKMLTIEVEGIQFPVYADQIDFPYFDQFTKKPTIREKKNSHLDIPRKEKKIDRNIPRDGVHLSFFPILDKDEFDENLFSHYRVYLLNHTDDELHVQFSLFYKDVKELETKHLVSALEDLYVFDLPFDYLNDQPKLIFIFSLVKQDPLKANQFSIDFKPKPKQFLKLSESTIASHNASFNYPLFEQYPGKEAEIAMSEPEKEGLGSDDGKIDFSLLSNAGFKVTKKR